MVTMNLVERVVARFLSATADPDMMLINRIMKKAGPLLARQLDAATGLSWNFHGVDNKRHFLQPGAAKQFEYSIGCQEGFFRTTIMLKDGSWAWSYVIDDRRRHEVASGGWDPLASPEDIVRKGFPSGFLHKVTELFNARGD